MVKTAPIGTIDFGEDQFVVLAAIPTGSSFEIVGSGIVSAKGFVRGKLTDISEAANSLTGAIRQAEVMAGIKLDGCVVAGVGGNHIQGEDKRAHVKIQGGAVTAADIDLAMDTLQAFPVPPDFEILHVLEQEFVIDGQGGIRHPLGMRGVLMEAEAHVVTARTNALANIKSCLTQARAAPRRLLSTALATGVAVTTDDERELGVITMDWGCGTCDYAVFHGGVPRKIGSLEFGGIDLDLDIAKFFRIPLANSKQVKHAIGSAVQVQVNEEASIEVTDADGISVTAIEPHLLSITIQHRVDEMLEHIKSELGSLLDRDRLPAGIVITGGMAELAGLITMCHDEWAVPVRIGKANYSGTNAEEVAGPRFAASLGLLQLCLSQGPTQELVGSSGGLGAWFRKLFGSPTTASF